MGFPSKKARIGKDEAAPQLESVTGIRGKMGPIPPPTIDGAPEPRIPLIDDTKPYLSNIPLSQGRAVTHPSVQHFLDPIHLLFIKHTVCVTVGQCPWGMEFGKVCSDII